MLIFMETHLTSCGDLRLFITGILEVEGGELIVSSALSTLELELLGRGILLVCVGILYVLLLISDLYLVGLAPCHFEDFLKKIMFEVGKFSLQLERSGELRRGWPCIQMFSGWQRCDSELSWSAGTLYTPATARLWSRTVGNCPAGDWLLSTPRQGRNILVGHLLAF